MLVDMSDTPIHRVDFAYEDWRVDESDILDIASMNDFWGQDLERPLIAIMNLKVNNKMVSVYRKDTNTVKISLPTGPDIMIFGAEKDFCDMLEKTQGYVKFNIVGECTRNEWGGSVTGQIKCKEYEILQEVKYIF